MSSSISTRIGFVVVSTFSVTLNGTGTYNSLSRGPIERNTLSDSGKCSQYQPSVYKYLESTSSNTRIPLFCNSTIIQVFELVFSKYVNQDNATLMLEK